MPEFIEAARLNFLQFISPGGGGKIHFCTAAIDHNCPSCTESPKMARPIFQFIYHKANLFFTLQVPVFGQFS